MPAKRLLLSAAAALLTAGAAAAQEAGAPALPAPADTAVPRTGIDPSVSDLREHLLDAYGDAPASPRGVSAPNLQITGQFGASEEYTTNAGATLGGGGGGRNVGSDFITAFQPGITIIDTSQRLQVNIDYHPIAQIYAENSSFSQLQEQGSGDILATLLPGWLYLDLRGSVSQQSVFGGVGPASTVNLSPDERETVTTFSVSPYVTRTFAGTGTAQAGVGYSFSANDAPSALNNGALNNPALNQQAALLQNSGAYGSSDQGTERAFASFTTGEDFGRVMNKAGVDASFYTGTGAIAGGRRVLLTDDVSYAWSRLVTVLGEAGYESLAYPRSFYGYIGAIGSGGVKLTPARGSALTLEYRYVDGFGAIFAQGSVQATPRIRVFGGYSESISTFGQDQQNALLDGGTDDVTGVAASGLQASPLLSTSNFFGANQNLARLHRFDLSASYLGNYDTVTLSVNRESTDPVGRQVGGFVPVTTSGIFGSATETHQLTETLSVNGFLQYGSNRTGLTASGTGDSISVSAGIQKSFARQISAYLRVGGTYYVGGSAYAASGTAGQSGSQTNVTIGALKRF